MICPKCSSDKYYNYYCRHCGYRKKKKIENILNWGESGW